MLIRVPFTLVRPRLHLLGLLLYNRLEIMGCVSVRSHPKTDPAVAKADPPAPKPPTSQPQIAKKEEPVQQIPAAIDEVRVEKGEDAGLLRASTGQSSAGSTPNRRELLKKYDIKGCPQRVLNVNSYQYDTLLAHNPQIVETEKPNISLNRHTATSV